MVFIEYGGTIINVSDIVYIRKVRETGEYPPFFVYCQLRGVERMIEWQFTDEAAQEIAYKAIRSLLFAATPRQL